MIFVSDRGVNESIRAERKVYTPTGHVSHTEKRLNAWFERGGAPPWAFDRAFEVFEYRGLPEGISRHERTFMFDSVQAQREKGWTDEEREIVEKYLLDRIASGCGDYVFIEQPTTDKPWPKYDEIVAVGRRTIDHCAQLITDTVRTLGLDPERVADYERENLNRPEVIEALSKVTGDEEVEVIEVPA